jgi:integrase
MVKRRSRGEGTIYQRSDGLWVAQITLPDDKRKTKYSKDQKTAREWLLALRNQLRDGLLPEDDKITVSQFFGRFTNEVLQYKVKPKTLDSYTSLINLHILPTLGYIKLIDLKPYHLQELYNQKKQSGLSNRTVQYIHAVIHRTLQQALRWGMVARKVSNLVEAPRPDKKTPVTFTIEESKRFLEFVKDDRLYPLYATAIGCGLRLGELLALDFSDLNFKANTISVKRNLQYIRGKGLVIGEPKSSKSIRSVVMPGLVVDALREHHQRTGKVSGWVFATSNGTPFSPRNIQRHFKITLEKAGLPYIHFHSLRHFTATSLLLAGVHPKVVQEMLGHSQISVTMDIYSHVLPTMQEEAADKLNQLLRI